MLILHEKCPVRVAQTGLLYLLVMQCRFSSNPETASQVATYQTQTYLHLIFEAGELLGKAGVFPPENWGVRGRHGAPAVTPPAGWFSIVSVTVSVVSQHSTTKRYNII